MLLDICLGTRSAWKILLFMSETPGKTLTRRQIQEHTKIGNKVLVKFLLLLKKFDLVQETKTGRTHRYKINMANSYIAHIIELIQIEKKELNNPYFSTTIILREFVYELTNIDFQSISQVILFGSVAKHTATIDSDIDIAIIINEANPKIELEIAALCGRIEKRFKRRIQPHLFTKKEFESKSKLVQEIINDRIRLM